MVAIRSQVFEKSLCLVVFFYVDTLLECQSLWLQTQD